MDISSQAVFVLTLMYCSGFIMGFVFGVIIIFIRSVQHYRRRKKKADEIISKLEGLEKKRDNGKPDDFIIFPGVKG